MRRDLRRLADEPFDLLIIGAGVYGAAMAWDAAQRGLSVALVDRGDIGGGTSFNNAKTVHGGVRSLQHGQLGDMREYLRERRAIARIVPHLVHPLPFLLPTASNLMRHWLPLRAYFALYDALTSDRNAGVDPAKRLPASRLVSREECLRQQPGALDASADGTSAAADVTGVTGGIVWHDYQMYSGDRVTLAYVKSAARAGAAIANYAEVTSLLQRDGRVIGATVRDRVTNDTFDVRATLTANVTGPWSGELLASLAPQRPVAAVVPALSLAMNVITRPVSRDCAVGGSAHGRLFFLAPWIVAGGRDVTIGGTSHDPFTGTASALRVTTADVTRLLDDLNLAFPGARLTLDDVRLVHRGLLPSRLSPGGASGGSPGRVLLLKHSRVRDHREDGWNGLISVVGVRYTTARQTAEVATDLACTILERSAVACRTSTTPLVGGEIADYATFVREATAASAAPGAPAIDVERLVRLYGTEHTRILDIARECPSLARPLGAHCPTLGAEILFAVREELALHVTDALLRRTGAGAAGHPGDDALTAAATIMGDALSWTPERRRDEIEAVERTYII